MNLSDVYEISLPRKKRKRVGRGHGSGSGKTSGRGHKGQKSRSGFGGRRWYEGGQMPLFRRLPKRGFNNKWRQEFVLVNLGYLEEHFQDGEQVTLAILEERGLLKLKKSQSLPLKVLGSGELTKKLTISAHQFSKGALEKLKKVGGEAQTLKLPKDAKREKLILAKKDFLKNKKK